MEERFRFFSPVQVRYADTDAQGRVFFANYLTYFDMARNEYFKAIGFPYRTLLERGVDFFEVESLCQYRSGAFFDEVLQVHARIERIGNTSFTTRFAIHEQVSGRLICRGHIVAVTVDRETERPVRVPDALRRAVKAYEPEGTLEEAS